MTIEAAMTPEMMIHPEVRMIDPIGMIRPEEVIHQEVGRAPMIVTVQAVPAAITKWNVAIQSNMTGMNPVMIVPIPEIFSLPTNRIDPTSGIRRAIMWIPPGITSRTNRICLTSAITVDTMHEPFCRMRLIYPIESTTMEDATIGILTASDAVLHTPSETIAIMPGQATREARHLVIILGS